MPWDPYPGTIRGDARCVTCGVGPISHPFVPEACNEYLAPVPASIAHLDPDNDAWSRFSAIGPRHDGR